MIGFLVPCPRHPHQDKGLVGLFFRHKGNCSGAFQISHQKLPVESQSASLSLSGSSNPLRQLEAALFRGERECRECPQTINRLDATSRSTLPTGGLLWSPCERVCTPVSLTSVGDLAFALNPQRKRARPAIPRCHHPQGMKEARTCNLCVWMTHALLRQS